MTPQNNRLLGLGLALLGVVCALLVDLALHVAGPARFILGVLLPAACIAAGIFVALRKPKPTARREQAAYYIPGFNPAHASKNIAIEGGTNRLWIRDPDRGEKVILPEQVLSWTRDVREGSIGITFQIDEDGAPVNWFVPFLRAESLDTWAERLNASIGKRSS